MSWIALGAMLEATEITPFALMTGSVIMVKVLSSSPERIVKSSPQHSLVRFIFSMSPVASLTVPILANCLWSIARSSGRSCVPVRPGIT